jgi:hypothetical protein
MSLRALPSSERVFATLVPLALAGLLGLGLKVVVDRELRPAPPATAPPAQSQLMAVLEGVMATNVTPGERERFRVWIAAGATLEGFAQVESVVVNNCASCHDRRGQYPRISGFEDLRPLALEPVPTGLAGLLGPRALHFAFFPALFLVGGLGYLRRTRWSWRRGLLAACLGAVALDALQWGIRQGRSELLWAAGAASVLLTLAMVALVTAVLADLWVGGNSSRETP